jgi:maltose alpha-D-glucosyltransferase/alpha-amylase
MGDDMDLTERECARTPMQWSAEPHAGFTKAARPIKPVITDGPYGYEHVNVAKQRRDPNSMVNWTERIIRMRKEVPEIGWGEFTIIDSGNDHVLVIRYDWRSNSVLTIHNMRGETTEVELRLHDRTTGTLVNLLTRDHSEATRGVHHIILDPYGYRWYRVGGLGYLLDRSAPDRVAAK